MADKHQTPRIMPADAEGMAHAVARLVAGEPVAIPTETVYGLAARADSADAVASIYRAKGRPDFNPLIVHVPSLAAAEEFALFDERARLLAVAFWPGTLTLVLPLREGAQIAPAVTAGLSTIALRCPAHPVMQAVLAQSGLPLAAPSANRSGATSPTTAAHVAGSLAGRIGLVLDGGTCTSGLESTIVAPRPEGWQLLRPGPVTEEQISSVLNMLPDTTPLRSVEAPGQLASHYAPGKPMRLDACRAEADEFLIGFGAIAGDDNLSPSGDLAEAAARLYACLHLASAAPHSRIAVAQIPRTGIGAAINDRLSRAAA